jgi:hypothetical protein
MLHHSPQKLKFVVDTARRDSFPHRRADLFATFLLIFADEFEIDPRKLDARADKPFDLLEDLPFARKCPFPVRRALSVEVHRCRFAEGRTA